MGFRDAPQASLFVEIFRDEVPTCVSDCVTPSAGGSHARKAAVTSSRHRRGCSACVSNSTRRRRCWARCCLARSLCHMRRAYHEKLEGLTASIGELCGLAGASMERATQALLQADLHLAAEVITDYDRIALRAATAEREAFSLLALQAPVAGDLRAILSAIRNIADVDRMGALALHVAKLARRRHPAKALPEEVMAISPRWGA
jgi:hypothetical protein